MFHALASSRRNQNSIWSLLDENGNSVEDECTLKEMGQYHFSHIFSDDKKTILLDQLRVAMLFPNMITLEDAPGLT